MVMVYIFQKETSTDLIKILVQTLANKIIRLESLLLLEPRLRHLGGTGSSGYEKNASRRGQERGWKRKPILVSLP